MASSALGSWKGLGVASDGFVSCSRTFRQEISSASSRIAYERRRLATVARTECSRKATRGVCGVQLRRRHTEDDAGHFTSQIIRTPFMVTIAISWTPQIRTQLRRQRDVSVARAGIEPAFSMANSKDCMGVTMEARHEDTTQQQEHYFVFSMAIDSL